MGKIPEEIRSKIKEKAKALAGISESKSVQAARERKYIQAIEYGYSLTEKLSPPEVEEKKVCLHPEKLWVHTPFGVHCDVCGEYL